MPQQQQQTASYHLVERYRDTYSYHAECSVPQLAFNVTLWSQTNIGESDPKKLCERRVQWGQKILSPKEGAAVINDEIALQRGTSTGAASSPKSLLNDGTAEQREFLSSVAACEGATLAEKFVAYCASSGLIFTRPPTENFVDPDIVHQPTTDPPMPTPPLPEVQMRRDITERGPPMNIMLACGYAEVVDATSVRFLGLETPLCSMFPILGDGRFTARPSLEAAHTAYVDQRSIFTYRVHVVEPADEEASPALALASVGSSIDLKRLRAVAAAAAADDSNTRQRRALLRQAVGTSDSSRVELSNAFTPQPLHKRSRLHIMGTVERATGIAEDSLFLKLTWLLPDNWEHDAAVNDELAVPYDSDEASITSQLAFGSLVRDGGGELATVHVFNLPFNAHLIGKPFGGAVRLGIEVFTLGGSADEFQAPRGYGQLTIPPNPGNYEVADVQLWAPKPTASETLKSIFVGGAPSLASVWDVAFGRRKGTGLCSKAGLQSVPTGSLHVRFLVAMQVGRDCDQDFATS